jgi:hypothetical protein
MRGDELARKRLLDGYLNDKNGYKKDPKKAAEINTQWAIEGDKLARQRHLEGYLNEHYGYEKDPSKAAEMNNKWALEGDIAAISQKWCGLHYGYYGYEKNTEAAARLDKEIEDNHESTLGYLIDNNLKIKLWPDKTDNDKNIELIKARAVKGHTSPLRCLIEFYVSEGVRYKADPEKVYTLMETWGMIPSSVLENHYKRLIPPIPEIEVDLLTSRSSESEPVAPLSSGNNPLGSLISEGGSQTPLSSEYNPLDTLHSKR